MDTGGWRLRLLGADPAQRVRASHALLVLAVYAVFAVVQHAEVMLGLIDERASWALTAYNLSGALLFFAAIRGGLNLRLRRDRALALPQSVWALGGIVWSYAITGPARGGVLLILLVVVLYGMFGLPAARMRQLTVLTLVLAGSVMAWKAVTDPQRYDPRVEAMHFLFLGIVLVTAAVLSIRLGAMRERLQQQRTDLAAALARIERLATCDELTGLTNRRAALERAASKELASGRLGVALLDIDHFKRVNDDFGHAAGDEVLRRFAAAAASQIRASDVLARWGGEEFLLLLPATSMEEGAIVIDRIRHRVAQTGFDDVVAGRGVTFSAGLSECPGGGDLHAAIERADRALYAAKHAGRHRTVVDAVVQPSSGTNFSATPLLQ